MLPHHQLRARIDELATEARGDPAGTELAAVALELLASLERARTGEVLLRTTVADLVAACRATVAAAHLGHPEPLIHIEHQLSAHGWAPNPDARPTTLLAATANLNLVPAAAAA